MFKKKSSSKEDAHEKDTLFCHDNKTRRLLVALLAGSLVLIVLLGSSVLGAAVVAKNYEDRVVPGLKLGDRSIGGLSRGEVKNLLVKVSNDFIDSGITLNYTVSGTEKNATIFPILVSESNSIEMLTLDIDAEADRLVSYNKGKTFLFTALGVMQGMFSEKKLQLQHFSVDRDRLTEQFETVLGQYEQPAKDAQLVIQSRVPLQYTVEDEQLGMVYDYASLVDGAHDAWEQLQIPTVTARAVQERPEISSADIQSQINALPKALVTTTFTFTHTDTLTGTTLSWAIGPDIIGTWVTLEKTDDSLGFTLDEASVITYLDETIADAVTIEPVNARFQVTDGKVSEFEGSRDGYNLDTSSTFKGLEAAYKGIYTNNPAIATTTIPLVVDTVSPTVSTAQVNDLGISEVLGVGISSYAGSPSNRIKNIRNAVNKLNGILVAPGEEFSTIEHTKPYTVAGGYLPELVIKGDEIKPEIGGGLCQIGTTLFRMAMNSGLKITERRNHSLVVNYYNDLTNGLPGTDATLYDPAPDFSFLNDTENYILVETDMDVSKQQLIFTIWGTNDGRDASYTPPTVHRWIPHGPTKVVETTKLAPGVRNCQHAYTGAETSFTYTRTMPDGTVEEEVFTSYYRPLPQICLVGVSENAPESTVGATCDPAIDPQCVQ